MTLTQAIVETLTSSNLLMVGTGLAALIAYLRILRTVRYSSRARIDAALLAVPVLLLVAVALTRTF